MSALRPDPALLRAELPLVDPVRAASFPALRERFFHAPLAATLGLGGLDAAARERHFGRFEPLPGNLPQPLALRYHGHQFRHYNHQLGDGRGFLFAQLRDGQDRLVDLGTKGSGETPWSRGGDGRLTLRGGVREVLAAALLDAHGLDSWMPLSLFETGDSLQRYDEPSPTRGSVLVRASHGSWRFGTFQRLAYLGDRAALRRLIDSSVATYFPTLSPAGDPAVALLAEVMARSAAMVAGWMVIGFVHGVLNTDNMSLTGQSFDYGPYRFIPAGDPGFVAAYFDEGGLYRFGRQAEAVLWNLRRLADALAEVAPAAALREALEPYGARLRAEMRAALHRRLGLRARGDGEDRRLVEAVSALLCSFPLGWERFFFDWYGGRAERAMAGEAARWYETEAGRRVRALIEAREPLGAPDHPYFQEPEPCTLLWEEIEAIFAHITVSDDWAPFHAKLGHIARLAEATGSRTWWRAPAA